MLKLMHSTISKVIVNVSEELCVIYEILLTLLSGLFLACYDRGGGGFQPPPENNLTAKRGQ